MMDPDQAAIVYAIFLMVGLFVVGSGIYCALNPVEDTPPPEPEPVPVLCTGCGEVRDDTHMHWLRDGRYRCTLCVLNPVKEFHP